MESPETPEHELTRRVEQMRFEDQQSADGRIPNDPLSVAERTELLPRDFGH